MREQHVARQNRHRVTPPRIRRFHPTPLIGLIHHIVVIKRRQVHNLHHTCCFINVVRLCMRAIFRRKQRHHRTEALATSGSQVQNLIRDELCALRKLRTQQVFDRFHPGSNARIELFIPQIHSGGVTRNLVLASGHIRGLSLRLFVPIIPVLTVVDGTGQKHFRGHSHATICDNNAHEPCRRLPYWPRS